MLRFRFWLLVPILTFLLSCANPPSQTPTVRGFDPAVLNEIHATLEQGIREGKTPGAVFWLHHEGKDHTLALGARSVLPLHEAMTLDSIFDVASLTKVLATAPSIMILVERGRLNLEQNIGRWFPGFSTTNVTVRQLLTHTSGLRAGLSRAGGWSGYQEGMLRASQEKPVNEPGTRIVYSDINYILLAEIVSKVSGSPLDQFALSNVFRPLGMKDTTFHPKGLEAARIVPSEKERGVVLRGEVHDPTARVMGGFTGAAGLFSTASDLSRFCRMMLNKGTLDGVKVLSPESVAEMTRVQTKPETWGRRGLGWDMDTDYSGARGDFFPRGSFGHTGWTGCAIWLDPFSRTFFVFLANRVHPDGAGNVLALNRRLGTLSAKATGIDFSKVGNALPPQVLTVANGIDVLEKENFARLRGKRIGLITNHTGRNKNGRPTIDLMVEAGLQVKALFSPEHGIRGVVDEKVGDAVDSKTGLPIFSLYGDRRSPSPDQLKDLDALVFDIQDIGCRFYTYIATMGLSMEVAGRAKIKFYVLDRVNPIGGVSVEGPLHRGESIFTAFHSLPVRHGMTVGELAKMFNVERKINADLEVLKIKGWDRRAMLDSTDIPWVNTSPNMRSLTEAILYPGVGLLETTALSVGRGTETPFELVGAPYVKGVDFKMAFDARKFPGIRVEAVEFTPNASIFKSNACGGLRLTITERRLLNSTTLGIILAEVLHELYPSQFNLRKFNTHLLNAADISAIESRLGWSAIQKSWETDEKEFARRRQPYLLY